MPELPEVETIARELNGSPLIGCAIDDVSILWHKTLATVTQGEFRALVLGQKLLSVGRRGKFLILELENDSVLIHLRMSGKLAIVAADAPYDEHERARLIFTDGLALQYRDTRKFGRWYLMSRHKAALEMLGPEPLEDAFNGKELYKILQSSGRAIKTVLLDQHKVAGIGNIYVDEALWEAKLHPQRQAQGITKKQSRLLACAIKKVLMKGIANSGTRLGGGRANYYSVYRRAGNEDSLNVFRRHGEACPRCGAIIQRITVAQRSTHFCPCCQKWGTVP